MMTTLHRYVLEKPFGRDLASCRALCAALSEVVREDEAYRIDHYLGKELVMNVLVLRFANVCFEAIWSRSHVERIEVCCFEEIGTAGRGGYFDKYGIIRDVLQNHLAQILALVAMEQPLSFDADDIRREKIKVLRSVRALDAMKDLVVGQYDGYCDDESVADKRSKTETFAAARLYIENPRWAGVPFILTAGKAVAHKKVEVKIIFRAVPGAVRDVAGCDPNELVVRVQPDECIYWRVQNRVPGLHSKLRIEARRMNLLYTPSESRQMPEAYERLVLEVLRGDATNFVSVDELDAAWAIFTDALDQLASRPSRPERYAFGSNGPCIRRLVDRDHPHYYEPPSSHHHHHRSRRHHPHHHHGGGGGHHPPSSSAASSPRGSAASSVAGADASDAGDDDLAADVGGSPTMTLPFGGGGGGGVDGSAAASLEQQLANGQPSSHSGSARSPTANGDLGAAATPADGAGHNGARHSKSGRLLQRPGKPVRQNSNIHSRR
mmetsp:Transcript_25174/g.100223  ORF Transcript_25174/g.100223 Transcript_25174/m.100223 type:complete len:493 (-) Transcript_25174:154-1632(-)